MICGKNDNFVNFDKNKKMVLKRKQLTEIHLRLKNSPELHTGIFICENKRWICCWNLGFDPIDFRIQGYWLVRKSHIKGKISRSKIKKFRYNVLRAKGELGKLEQRLWSFDKKQIRDIKIKKKKDIKVFRKLVNVFGESILVMHNIHSGGMDVGYVQNIIKNTVYMQCYLPNGKLSGNDKFDLIGFNIKDKKFVSKIEVNSPYAMIYHKYGFYDKPDVKIAIGKKVKKIKTKGIKH